MGRKKGKKGRGEYLPGANWRDVVAGQPVTRVDVKARRARPKPVQARCRDRGRPAALRKTSWVAAAPPRCRECGGLMDPAPPS